MAAICSRGSAHQNPPRPLQSRPCRGLLCHRGRNTPAPEEPACFGPLVESRWPSLLRCSAVGKFSDASSKKKLVQEWAMQTWSNLLRHVMIQRTRIALWEGQVIQHVPRMRWRLIQVTMDPNGKRNCARVLDLRRQVGTDGKISTTKL